MRLVMPPSVSVPLASGFVIAFVLIMGTPTAWAFSAGFLAGYVIYDEIHYHLHHHMPKTRVGKLLRELHMRHHFQDDTRGFGISAPYWDRVFRTYLKRGAKS
jgi:sterol desaturase/sphingolipid hydroxylase (fatty acid hydroxylase superfamily)